MKILVSACLLGIPCRYDGGSKPCDQVVALAKKHQLVPFCPEIYGGLPTPRTPAERIGEKVIAADGRDVTKEYEKGARQALDLCRMMGCERAILKARSPSCGKGQIYDGTFSGALRKGDGVTAQLLMESGIQVDSEERLISK